MKNKFSKGMLRGLTVSVMLGSRTKVALNLLSWNKACAITCLSIMLNHHGQLLRIIDLNPIDWRSVWFSVSALDAKRFFMKGAKGWQVCSLD